jgi:hypothetical protein
MSVKNVTVLWTKLILTVVFMLTGLAMVVYVGLGITFTDFWSQFVLFFIAMSVGIIGVILVFRTKLVVIR